MVEIHKFIAYIPFLYQIFDDKNNNGSVKGANNNQVYMSGNFYASVFFMIKNIVIGIGSGVSILLLSMVLSLYAAILFLITIFVEIIDNKDMDHGPWTKI